MALIGLAGLIVPLAVHLFNLRRFRVVILPSVELLISINQRTKKMRELKNILVLLARMLIVFLIVASFARPELGKDAFDSHDTVFYLDNSFSLQNEVESGVSGLERGVRLIEAWLDASPASGRFRLVTNDFGEHPTSWLSRQQLRDKLTEMRFSDKSRTFQQVIGQTAGLSVPHTVVYFSDFQESTFGEFRVPKGGEELDLILAPIRFRPRPSVLFDSVYVDRPVLMPGEPIELHVVLRNAGNQKAPDLQLEVLRGNKLVHTSGFSLDIQETQDHVVRLDLGLLKSPRLQLKINDAPLHFDNRWRMIVNPYQRIRVCYIYQDAPSRAFLSLFANQELFEFAHFPLAGLDYEHLKSSGLVVLHELGQIPPSLLQKIQDLNVVLIPSKAPDLDSYGALFARRMRRVKKPERRPLVVGPQSASFFDGVFARWTDRLDMPDATRSLESDLEETSVLSDNFGNPFLIHVEGQTSRFLFTGPFGEDYTDLTKHGLFLPLFYRMAFIGNPHFQVLSAFSPDDRIIRVTNQGLKPGDEVVLRGPDLSVYPDHAMSRETLTLYPGASSLSAGFYDIESEDSLVGGFAVNPDKRESLPAAISDEVLTDWVRSKEGLRIIEAEDAVDFSTEGGQRAKKFPLYKGTLLLAMLFLAVETFALRKSPP